MGVIIIIHISGGSSLYLLEDLDVSLVMQIQYSRCVVERWPDHCGVCCCLHLFHALFEVQEFGLLSWLPLRYVLTMLDHQTPSLPGIYWHQSPQGPVFEVYMKTERTLFLFFPEVIPMMVHFDGLKLICHARSHCSSAERSS